MAFLRVTSRVHDCNRGRGVFPSFQHALLAIRERRTSTESSTLGDRQSSLALFGQNVGKDSRIIIQVSKVLARSLPESEKGCQEVVQTVSSLNCLGLQTSLQSVVGNDTGTDVSMLVDELRR